MPTRWLMLLVLFLARTAMAYQFQTVGSCGPFLVDALGIDYAVLGTLIGLYMLPGIVFALPGGVLGQRFGAKGIVLPGLALMVLGGALTASESVAVIVAGRALSGTGAVLINVLMTKMVTDWFAGREIVTAMAVFIASWPLGLAMGLLTFAPVALATSWRAVMLMGAALALVALLLVAAVYREPPGAARGLAQLRVDLSRREWSLILLAGLIWSAYNVGYIVLISFLPELFAARGFSLTDASRLVSLLGWVLIPSVPLAGYVAERFGRPNVLMAASLVAVAAATAILPFVPTPAAVFVFIVLAIGIPAGLIMALPAQALTPGNRSSGMGVFYTAYYVGMAALPPVAGLTRDWSGNLAATTSFCAGMMVLAVLGLWLFRRVQTRSPAPA
jgi:predicted MFS family arabinose efflux permease